MSWFEDPEDGDSANRIGVSTTSLKRDREIDSGIGLYKSGEREDDLTVYDGVTPYSKNNKRRKRNCDRFKREGDMSPVVIVAGNKAPPLNVMIRNMKSAPSVKAIEMDKYFHLLSSDPMIRKFIEHDECMKFADKYLLVVAFAYFKRCNFSLAEYNRINFFLALYLAHDVEEDDENLKYEIFPWALGPYWREKLVSFLSKKEDLWARMNYRAVVSRRCCEELMALCPSHFLWTRTRPVHHGGAVRSYMREPDSHIPRGPDASVKQCCQCSSELFSSNNGELSASFPDSGLDCSIGAAISDNTEESDASDSTIDDILTMRKHRIRVSKLFAGKDTTTGQFYHRILSEE